MKTLKIKCGCCKKLSGYKKVGIYYRCKNCLSLNEIKHTKDCKCGCLTYESINNEKFITDKKDYELKEWLNFNYKDFLMSIRQYINQYDFKELIATSKMDLDLGRFNSKQVARLKYTLKDGFMKGESLNKIAKRINNYVKPGPNYYIDKEGNKKIRLDENKRSMLIARTEVTRTANGGAMLQYKDNNIKKIRWISSYGMRTCPECADLNNQIFEIGEVPAIPLHAMCRCTLEAIEE